jgi:hypothetical protein
VKTESAFWVVESQQLVVYSANLCKIRVHMKLVVDHAMWVGLEESSKAGEELVQLYDGVDIGKVEGHSEQIRIDERYAAASAKHQLLITRYLVAIHRCDELLNMGLESLGWLVNQMVVDELENHQWMAWRQLVRQERYGFKMMRRGVERINQELDWMEKKLCGSLEDGLAELELIGTSGGNDVRMRLVNEE